MIKKIKYIVLSFAIFSGVSCDFMNIVPDMIDTIEDNAFSMRTQAEKYFFLCYSYMPQFGNVQYDPALFASDELWVSDYYTGGSIANARNILMGNQRSNNPYLDYWCGINSNGKMLYRGISDCNIFLANIDRVPDIPLVEKNLWKSEVEMLKVFYHFLLVRMYGPIPIKDTEVSMQDEIDAVKVYRNTLDECFAYMTDRVDEILARNHLLREIDPAFEFGRINRGIALMLKAKILITAASPLFNGNTDYKGLKDKRGIEIFNPDKTEEEKRSKWVAAATACKEALDYFEERNDDILYTFENTTQMDISDTTILILSIRGAMTERYPTNPEIIWANTRTGDWDNTTFQQHSHPRDIVSGKAGTNSSNRGSFSAPLKVKEWFYTKNGVPINEDKTWDYGSRYGIKPILNTDDNKYLLYSGGASTGPIAPYTTVGLNFDREYRYYASLGFDMGIWWGQGNHATNNASTAQTRQVVWARAGGFAMNSVLNSFNATGIWPKKVVHYNSTVANSAGTSFVFTTYPFPIFRVADLFLMYAEAMNEAYDTQEARNEAIRYIDKVRGRAGLKGVDYSWKNFSNDPTKHERQMGLRSIIQQEITVEFMFEGHRFWDVRRWKIANDETSMLNCLKPITGWKMSDVSASAPEDYYQEQLIHTYRFSPRDYFWPIHDGEILRNSNTLQNLGW